MLSHALFLPAVGYEVPDGPEEEPRDGVGHDKDEERAAPVEVDQRGEDVRQVAVSLPHVAVLDVAAAVLLHVALPLTASPGWRTDNREQIQKKKKRGENKQTCAMYFLYIKTTIQAL